MKIKVCGLTEKQNIQQVLALNADYMGLIFYPASPRYIGNDEALASWIKGVTDTQKTGVFVNEKEDAIREKIDAYGLDLVQLHGEESPEYCSRINALLPVIKAFPVHAGFVPHPFKDYAGSCTAFLFDTAYTGYGGSGKRFDWRALDNLDIPLPFFLSGGIGPEAVKEIKALKHPGFMAIDVNSRFEQAPGIKNIDLLKTFIHEIRH